MKNILKTQNLIYKRSLDEGCVPAALIVTLCKKGPEHLPSDYRPVFLTSVACKVLEHIIHSNIRRRFGQFNILMISFTKENLYTHNLRPKLLTVLAPSIGESCLTIEIA